MSIAKHVDSPSSLSYPTFVLEEFLEKRRRLAQRRRIDIERTQSAVWASLLADKLKLIRKTSDAEVSIVV